MSTVYNSFVSSERVQRNVVAWFGISCVTILCHLTYYNPSVSVFPLKENTHSFAIRYQDGNRSLADDKKPKAKDDEVSTLEEKPIQFNILTNDVHDQGQGNDDDDDDDDDDGNGNGNGNGNGSEDEDDAIDPSTVDLNPDTESLDKLLNTESGSYAVNAVGEVTFIPAVNFAGKSQIEYSVKNLAGETSDDARITVNVVNVNDPPAITAQSPNPISTTEGTPLTIAFDNLIVTDPDNNYPDNFSITALSGPNYSAAGNVITPAQNFSGLLSVPVTVSDGSASSLPYTLKLSVTSENESPVITGQTPNPIVATEDQSFVVDLNNLLVTDPDDAYPANFTLQVLAGTNYTVEGNAITPAANYFGPLSIPVIVNDGDVNSNTFNVQVTVNNVNDAPQITGQNPNPITTTEDQPVTITFGNLTVADPDNTYPNGFTMTLSPGNNYTVNGQTVTPSPGYSGPLSIPVIVNDGQANSNQFTLSINVTNANDAPVITGQNPLTVDENNSITITLAHLTVTDDDNSYPTGFTLTAAAGANYTLSGNTVTPAPNFSGTLTVPVTVNDGTSTSNSFPLSITVNPVNDAPVVTGQTALSTNEATALTLTTGNFSVTDVDNAYPTGFSLVVLPGTNYSVSGTTITPAPGFNGTLSVGVQVNDGTNNSNVFNAVVTVAPVNDAPVITGSQTLTVEEDNSVTPTFADLTVTDADNTYPNGFTLTVLAGTNYTVSGGAVVPLPNYSGPLTVNIVVNDGTSNSNTFGMPVNVTPVNDAPVITGQQPLSVVEDGTLTIDLTHLTATDVDNSFPTGFTLTVFPGSNYTLNGNAITPLQDFRGTLSVPVQVSDGTATSNIFQLQISVTDVNDTPVITGQTPVATTEDTPVAISLGNLTVLDPDNTYPLGFTLGIGQGTNYTVSGNIITPALDFNGTLNVPVTVNDGSTTSAPFTFQIQVGDANDPPVITGQSALSTNEETSLALAFANFTVTDPDNIYPNGFTLQVSAGENYTVQGTTITPAANFVGTLTVPVRVNDGINNSPTFNALVQINPVNDPPSFDAIANQTLQENAVPAPVSITGISKGPGETDQQLTLTAVSSNPGIIPNPTISYGGGTSARLTYTVVPNTNGAVTITVTATDNGSSVSPHSNSYSASFQINVVEVNNAPTLDNIGNVTMLEDAALQNVSLTGITAGPGESQVLTVSATSDKPNLFETLTVTYTSPQPSGILQIKPAANSAGVATITVKVTDDGSNIAPSANSVIKTFTVTIQPVNDVPVFTSTPVTVAAVGEPYEYIVTFTDVETPDLAVSATRKPDWASLVQVSAGKFRLAGTPPPSARGETSVELRVSDNDVSATQQFLLVVNNRPVAKPITFAIQEDNVHTFNPQQFLAAYSDIDQHPLKAVQFTQLPANAKLILAGVEVAANDTIDIALIADLKYQPALNYDKPDVFFWKAFDGYHLSAAQASVDVTIQPVNDAPTITLSQDTLQFEVNGEPKIVSDIFDIEDPDNDSLSRAEIIFTENFDIQFDQLIVQQSARVRGFYELESGRIILTGLAPIEEYEGVIRNIQYNHLNTLDPVLKRKRLTYTASDGIATSEPADRLIDLKYTFIELEIPSGFTPNGDQANDTWVISRPGGLEQLQGASIRVMNRRGVVVFETKGFSRPWDGTLNGTPLPADSYFFSIDLNLRSKKTYKGVVTILR